MIFFLVRQHPPSLILPKLDAEMLLLLWFTYAPAQGLRIAFSVTQHNTCRHKIMDIKANILLSAVLRRAF